MPPLPTRPLIMATAACLALTAPVSAQDQRADISPADIESASFSGTGELPQGQSALTAKVQILLDRSGVSPGVVDGFRGGMSESAIQAFERKHGLPQDGRLDPQVWGLLQQFASGSLTTTYTVTEEDAQGLVDSIPADYAEKAAMSAMGYTSVAEKLAERFHMDEKFLVQLNKGTPIAPGATITVTVPAEPIKTKVARIVVDKATGRVAAYDVNGDMVADYPATVGSDATPSPHGSHLVEAIALDPNYTYNPDVNFKQGDNDQVLTVPPGPNGPVGNVWIDLSKPTYGIHGTATPSRLFVNESNGCVRLTNWDARELAGMVQTGQTIVDFLAPGVMIADVTKPVTPPETAEGMPVAAEPGQAGAGTAPGQPAPATGPGLAFPDASAPPALTLGPGRPVPRRVLPGGVVPAAPTNDPALAGQLPDDGGAATAPAPYGDPLASALADAMGEPVQPQPYGLPSAPAQPAAPDAIVPAQD